MIGSTSTNETAPFVVRLGDREIGRFTDGALALATAKRMGPKASVWHRAVHTRVVETQTMHAKDKASKTDRNALRASTRVGGESSYTLTHRAACGVSEVRVY